MKTLVSVAALAVALGAGSASAADPGVKIGTLTCQATDINNAILISTTTFDCEFDGAGGQVTEHYTGQIDRIGVDLTIKNNVSMVWAVIAPSETEYAPNALEGTYVGAGGSAAVGAGAGAHVLVGGGDQSFTLQPVSIEGITGIGASLGIESFKLTS